MQTAQMDAPRLPHKEMTMTYLAMMTDGAIYAGRTCTEVVTRMREAGLFTAGKSDMEYMLFVSHRAKFLSDVPVRYDTAENFLHDLQATKLLILKAL